MGTVTRENELCLFVLHILLPFYRLSSRCSVDRRLNMPSSGSFESYICTFVSVRSTIFSRRVTSASFASRVCHLSLKFLNTMTNCISRYFQKYSERLTNASETKIYIDRSHCRRKLPTTLLKQYFFKPLKLSTSNVQVVLFLI